MEGAVHRFGVGKVGHEGRIKDDEVCALLELIGVLSPDALAEVEVWSRGEGIEFKRLLHIGAILALLGRGGDAGTRGPDA